MQRTAGYIVQDYATLPSAYPAFVNKALPPASHYPPPSLILSLLSLSLSLSPTHSFYPYLPLFLCQHWSALLLTTHFLPSKPQNNTDYLQILTAVVLL